RADAPVAVAADLLRAGRIRHLPVVDGTGRLVGIVTDRDLRQLVFDPVVQEALGQTAAALSGLKVREIMTWGVLSVRPDTDLRAAARLMRERRIGALPVVDNGGVVGILSETDVLAAFEKVLSAHLTTVRPLAAALTDGEPYDYGFPVPGAGGPDVNEGTVD
ncbi:MAG TPA: CBS domain-containing protein, partial [Methylomirabilota bacterium]|nr:CBS domain-containing protein [Methylomirabilota bacterium]